MENVTIVNSHEAGRRCAARDENQVEESCQARKVRAGKAKPTKKPKPGAKAVAKPATERANKKAEVIALMKRAKSATLAEIVEATGWQTHTVRGFVSILGSKGGEKIESSKERNGERTYRIGK